MGKKITAFLVALSGILSFIAAMFLSSRAKSNDGSGNSSRIDEQFGKARSLDNREREINQDERNALDREGGRILDERSELDGERTSIGNEKTIIDRDRSLLEELQKRNLQK